MNLKINPITNSLNGEITAPGSKSYSHRTFVAASLAEGISIIKNPLISGDVAITIKVLESLGVRILRKNGNAYIIKRDKDTYKPVNKFINCGNSGTTLRIFSALSLIIEGGLKFKGDFLRLKRPILPLLNSLKQLGAEIKLSKKKLKIKRTSEICNKVMIQGDVSSQFLTALLILCPLLKCKNKDYIEIELTSQLVSKPFIEITLEVLDIFGINIQADFETGKFYITKEQNYRSQSYAIPGDFSSAANIIAVAILSKKPSSVIINNLSFKNKQGDKQIVEILEKMGAKIKINEESHQVIIGGELNENKLKGIEVDCSDIPDLFPILSVIGAFAEGKTTLYNASNLRLKETDRIKSMATQLKKMGVTVIEEADKLTIFHCEKLNGTTINHNNDHRIAMACTVAALHADSDSYLKKSEIVEDSYPSFFKDLKELGAKIESA
ncbi:MAG: 3-phosphoshikimate 1-carboxyvinyltransferase [Promethearchaeota archaeon]